MMERMDDTLDLEEIRGFFEIAGLQPPLRPPVPFEPERPPPVPPSPPETEAPPATPPAPSAVRRRSEARPEERYDVRIRELSEDERPRERLIRIGPEALTTAELLAILIRTGTEKRSAVGVADQLLTDHGGLRGVARLSVDELSRVAGIGPAKAAQIKAAIEFGRRLVAASPEERTKIGSPRDVYNLLGPTLRDEPREHVIALLMDTKGGVLRQSTISIGDLSSSIVHPREVFREAIRCSAASLILVHNHPSGDPTPSPEDIAITHRLNEAGDLIGIELLDHIIIGDHRWTSLREKGHL
ncbi:MAG: DNA repair protein RadC [Capsulimonadales bacterium]|nr:DNA repair protein RadC [Capsulimonadales bacterium]